MFVPASFTQVFTRPSQILNVSICVQIWAVDFLISSSFPDEFFSTRTHSDTLPPVDVSNHKQNLLQFVSEVCGSSSKRSSVAQAGLKRTKLAARRRKWQLMEPAKRLGENADHRRENKGQAGPKETELSGRSARLQWWHWWASERETPAAPSGSRCRERSQKARTEATPLRCEFITLTCTASSEEQKTSGRVSMLVLRCHDRDPQQDTGDAHYWENTQVRQMRSSAGK